MNYGLCVIHHISWKTKAEEEDSGVQPRGSPALLLLAAWLWENTVCAHVSLSVSEAVVTRVSQMLWISCCCLVVQSCLTLCDPVDYSPPGSSVHGILQARMLEWIAMPLSRGSSQPRGWTQAPALWADSLLSEPPGKPILLTWSSWNQSPLGYKDVSLITLKTIKMSCNFYQSWSHIWIDECSQVIIL